jgi:peroxiredoxin
MKRMILTVLGIIALALPVAAQVAAPAFELPDVNGTKHSLSQYAGKIVVLEWTNYDCPFVKKFYGPGAMQAMQEKYTGKEVVWLSISSSAPGNQGNFSQETWKKRIADTGSHATAVLLDPEGKVGRAYGASNTPHIFVVGPDGKLAYEGSVDDQRSADPDTIQGARNYLAEALDALLDGKPVPTPKTKPYGCSVKYAK